LNNVTIEALPLYLGRPSPAPSIKTDELVNTSGFQGQSPRIENITLHGHPLTAFGLPAGPKTAQKRFLHDEEMEVRRLLKISELQYGTDSSVTINNRLRLCEVLCQQGRYKSAEEAARHSILDARKLYGDRDVQTLRALTLLGVILSAQGLLMQAAKLLRRAVNELQAVAGETHDITLFARRCLACSLDDLGEISEAEEQIRAAISASAAIGSDELKAYDLMTLSRVMRLQGRRLESSNFLMQAIDLLSKSWVPVSKPSLISATTRLAMYEEDNGSYPRADNLYSEAREKGLEFFGPDHPLTLEVTARLGLLWSRLGRREGLEILRDTLERMQRVLGPDHEATHSIFRQLASFGVEGIR
jgi:tetratricopeptide (TPR) repeat protein